MWSLPLGFKLSAEAETLDQRTVSLDVHLHHVVQQPAAAADQQQEPATGVVVVLVSLEVLGEADDALGQQRDLGLGGSGVRVVHAVLGKDRLLLFGGQSHSGAPRYSVPCGPDDVFTPGETVTAATDCSRTRPSRLPAS